eukprot:scaffold2.g7430.t1
MSGAPLSDKAAQHAGGHATGTGAGFISKQTPLSQRVGASDVLPPAALQAEDRPREPPPMQVESDGPEVMMAPLRQADGEQRRRAVAEAMRATDEDYARTTARDMAGGN